jgi:hypothetical protein
MQIADGLEPVRQDLGVFQARQEDQVVDFSYFLIFFVDGADFAGDNEPGLKARSHYIVRLAEIIFQGIKPFFSRTSFSLSSSRQAGWLKSLSQSG